MDWERNGAFALTSVQKDWQVCASDFRSDGPNVSQTRSQSSPGRLSLDPFRGILVYSVSVRMANLENNCRSRRSLRSGVDLEEIVRILFPSSV